MKYTPEQLRKVAERVLAAGGASASDAELVASRLIVSNLVGHDSHGRPTSHADNRRRPIRAGRRTACYLGELRLTPQPRPCIAAGPAFVRPLEPPAPALGRGRVGDGVGLLSGLGADRRVLGRLEIQNEFPRTTCFRVV